jgi:hypothetical protein
MLLERGVGSSQRKWRDEGGGTERFLFRRGGKAGLYPVAGEPLLVKYGAESLPSSCPLWVGGGGGQSTRKSGGAKALGWV